MQPPFEYRDNLLHMEDVPLDSIGRRVHTPCYVYSASAILDRYHAYDEAFERVPHRVCYAVKANSNLSILALLARKGSAFDIVSGGELYRVLKAGGAPESVVFSGVGKSAAEVEYAIESGIHSFNSESEAELSLLNALAARHGQQISVSVRVNPDVDAKTHPYISTGLKENKFGIDISEAEAVYERARGLTHLKLNGVSCHIGSQMLDAEPMLEAVDRVVSLAIGLRKAGFPIKHLDLGGGLGVPYRKTEAPRPSATL